MNEDQIKQLIKDQLKDNFAKKIGDTPTEALQLVNKKYVDNKIAWGKLNADGTIIRLPTGWTGVRNSQGHYTITHNLGVSYGIVANPIGGILMASPSSITNNSFVVILYDASSVAQDSPWGFILTT